MQRPRRGPVGQRISIRGHRPAPRPPSTTTPSRRSGGRGHHFVREQVRQHLLETARDRPDLDVSRVRDQVKPSDRPAACRWLHRRRPPSAGLQRRRRGWQGRRVAHHHHVLEFHDVVRPDRRHRTGRRVAEPSAGARSAQLAVPYSAQHCAVGSVGGQRRAQLPSSTRPDHGIRRTAAAHRVVSKVITHRLTTSPSAPGRWSCPRSPRCRR